MANIELINLVTTRLVQEKKEIEHALRFMLEGGNNQPNKVNLITDELREYNLIIGDIQLWESLLDEITPPEQKETGDNNNN